MLATQRANQMDLQVFQRNAANPILTARDMPCPVTGVFNPGVALVGDEVVLLARIEDRRGISHLRVVRSSNGVDNWRFDPKPFLAPGLPEWPYEEWGCEDPRISKLPGESRWLIAYTSVSRYGPAISLAATKDFHQVERWGMIMAPNNKDCAIFPDRLEKKWLMLHRPTVGVGEEHIWYASSDDLLHWTSPGILMPMRGGPWWDGHRIGAGAPPFETPDGWLMIYHGVKDVAGRPVYRLGSALLDKNNHRRVAARTSSWIFAPEANYELIGVAPAVVYTCGVLLRGDEVWMYYGAADSCICLAIAKLPALVELTHQLDYIEALCQEGMPVPPERLP
jgi:beta-1,4-mannooligosaccharide/beta-1,4-mannosyl-N-acetylglucosamine phosphorylase